MTYTMMRNASSLYRRTDASAVENADRHQLVGMLLDGLMERINRAYGQVQRGDTPGKGTSFSGAIAIVVELRTSLNHEAAPELAANLDALYDYVTRRLLHAQLNDDLDALDECRNLIAPIRESWQEIRPQYLEQQHAVPA